MFTLRLVSRKDVPDPIPEERVVGGGGMTLGRDVHNDWVLYDPQRHVSKQHCVVRERDGLCVVHDNSTNGVYVNDEAFPIGNGHQRVVDPGDRLRIGPYRFEVLTGGEHGAGIGFPDPEATLRTMEVKAPPSGFGSPGRFGPDADWLQPNDAPPPPHRPVWQPESPPYGARKEPPVWGGSRPAGTPDQDGVPLPGGSSGLHRDPLERDDVEARPMWDADANAETDAATAALFPFGEDWDADPLDTDGGFADGGFADAERRPHAQPEHHPPVPQPVPSVADPAATPPDGRPGTAGGAPPRDAALVSAFLDAAGLADIDAARVDGEALMREAGAVLRTAVTGLRDVLEARSMTRSTLHAPRTLYRAGANPLKFSASPEEALARLLARGLPDSPGGGCASGPAPVREAADDILGHELALVRAIDVALRTLIARFDPEGLKARLDRSSLLARVVAGGRRARYWEAYEAEYGAISREVDASFRHAFAEAVEKLKGS